MSYSYGSDVILKEINSNLKLKTNVIKILINLIITIDITSKPNKPKYLFSTIE